MELIDRQEAIKAIDDVLMEDEQYKVWFKLGINNLKPVDAEPVRHGKWMPREEGCVYPFWERYTCSVCGKHADNTEYCPHCGARMVKDD